MTPIHDIDALLLLATVLSAKRRPARLVEIMAAIDLLHGNIPAEQKLGEALARLAVNGLLVELDGGIALTPAGASFPLGHDPRDRNIRLAPSFPELDEVETAMAGVATCVALATAERLAVIG